MAHSLAVPAAGRALLSQRANLRPQAAPPRPGSGGLDGAHGQPDPVGTDDRVWAALLGEPPLGLAELQALAALSTAQACAPGQALLDRSRRAPALVALARGEAALGWRTADGTFRTERIVHGPAWLDQSAAWLDAPPAMDASALSAVTLLALPVAGLSRSLASQPGLVQRLIRGLATEVQALAMNTHELMHKDAPARLAQWLRQRLQPAEGLPGQGVVKLSERKRDVASQLAITPETLSRLMRSFSRQGVIEVSGYLVRVLDVDALGVLASA